MATVTAVDSQNQVFALTCDMIAFLLYVKLKKGKYIVWISLIFLATLFKENGLMWAWICPILAYGFDFIDKKILKKDLLVGIAIMVVYLTTLKSSRISSNSFSLHSSLLTIFICFINPVATYCWLHALSYWQHRSYILSSFAKSNYLLINR